MHINDPFLHQTPNQVICAGEWIENTGRNFGRHSHPTWEVIYHRSGNIETVQGDDKFAMHSGMILTHPPNVPHSDIAEVAYSLYWIYIATNSGEMWPRLCYDDEHNSIGNVCGALVREWARSASDRDEMLIHLAAELDLLLRRSAEEQRMTEAHRSVTAAQRLLEARYDTPWTIREIADEVGVSPSSLHANFARILNTTPMEFLQSIRLRHALAQLHHTNKTLEDIAIACGFHSASHLSRHVKAATRRSPGSLRNGLA